MRFETEDGDLHTVELDNNQQLVSHEYSQHEEHLRRLQEHPQLARGEWKRVYSDSLPYIRSLLVENEIPQDRRSLFRDGFDSTNLTHTLFSSVQRVYSSATITVRRFQMNFALVQRGGGPSAGYVVDALVSDAAGGLVTRRRIMTENEYQSSFAADIAVLNRRNIGAITQVGGPALGFAVAKASSSPSSTNAAIGLAGVVLTGGCVAAYNWFNARTNVDNIRRRSFGEGQEWMDPGVDADIIPGDGNDTWIDAETSGPELIRYMLSVGLNQGLYAFSSPNLGN